jgi:hypothetical protein
MRALLDWFNGNTEGDWVVKAGLAHLWFVTIHPFEDGNGRIARAIADLALARSEHSSQRFYSMSAQIRQERADYYDILERAERATMDIAPWMDWFLGCLGRAIEGAQATSEACSPKRTFGRPLGTLCRMNDSVLLLTTCSMASRGKLTTMKYGKLHTTPHCVTSPLLLNGVY